MVLQFKETVRDQQGFRKMTTHDPTDYQFTNHCMIAVLHEDCARLLDTNELGVTHIMDSSHSSQ